MLRIASAALACLLLAPAALAETPPAPSAELTPDQRAALGKIVPSGGFAHFSGMTEGACKIPVLYASGYKPWTLTIVHADAMKFDGPREASENAGPSLPGVLETYRRTVERCGFPVPAVTGQSPLKGKKAAPRQADPALIGTLPGPATLAYLSGAAENMHNLPAVFVMRHGDTPVAVVAGKGHPMKAFPLPGGWNDAMTAYQALLKARGYR